MSGHCQPCRAGQHARPRLFTPSPPIWSNTPEARSRLASDRSLKVCYDARQSTELAKRFVLAQWRNHANFFGQLCRRRLWLDKGRRAYIRYALYSLPPSPACTPFLLALACRPCLACPSQLPKQSFVMANFQSSHVGGRLRRSRRKPHFVRGVSLTLSFTHSFDPTSLLPFDLSRHSDRLGRPHATRTGKSCQTSINTSREG